MTLHSRYNLTRVINARGTYTPLGVSRSPAHVRRAVAQALGEFFVIDGAAQDWRLAELLATGADIVLTSAHKYLAAPTAGLVVGRAAMVAGIRAQERGIGRAMKPSKETLLGVLAALETRETLDPQAWRKAQARKVAWFIRRAGRLPGVDASALPDPSGMPFSRVCLRLDIRRDPQRAARLAAVLESSRPSIRVMTHELAAGRLILELVPLTYPEMDTIVARLRAWLSSTV